jgi:hypothetical protein
MLEYVRARRWRAFRGGGVAGVIGAPMFGGMFGGIFVMFAMFTMFSMFGVVQQSEAATSSATTSPRDAFAGYGASYRRIDLPPAQGGSFFTTGDALPDGRLVAATGDGVFAETGVGTGVFELVSTIDTALFGGAPDPAFLRVSPDGQRAALGGGFGKPLAIFELSSLGTGVTPTMIGAGNADFFAVNHFDAEWLDSSNLAITAGDFGDPALVSLLDVTSSTLAPVNPVIVSNINGASGGIAFDDSGRLYTGNGFGSGAPGSDTGWIRVFDPGDWSVGSPADFELDGVFLGDVLSASSLSIDPDGNLVVGGGDFSEGQTGYLGVVSASAIAGALLGFGPVDINDPLQLKRLDPIGTGSGFFGSSFNPITGELYVTDGSTWWATVPSPGPALALVISAGNAFRRRKRAA